MAERNILCEHIKVAGQKGNYLTEGSLQETIPAFNCGLVEQRCRYATRKQQCPTYQDYLLDNTETPSEDLKS